VDPLSGRVPISLLCPIIFVFITTAEIDAFKEAEAADGPVGGKR
jgi:hypothetical protein